MQFNKLRVNMLIQYIIVNLFVIFSFQQEIKNEKCRICNFLVSTFDAGLKKTARHHFAGGDTAWEEKNLGSYKTSETRLIEVLEGVCKKASLSSMDGFTGISEIEFKCASQMESNEETIEEYYYKQQNHNMSIWLCVEQLKYCCPSGHFGKNCEQCPGLTENVAACYGRGSCHGDGSRQGTGKCKCDDGYTGNLCRHCDSEYFEESKSENSITCKKCYEGCLGECKSDGPSGCSKCKNGWTFVEGQGCIDVDECQNREACQLENEKCINSIGSFRCDCKDGYKRDDNKKCQLDIEAKPNQMILPPDQLLKAISMTSLVFIITFVVWYRSTLLYVLTTIAVIALILIDTYVTPQTIPDEAKRILGF